MKRTVHRLKTRTRRGSLLPVVVVALLVVAGVMSLVLNRLWIDAARTELQRATDASVLAAANELVSDELLLNKSKTTNRISDARQIAAKVASQNAIAGDPLILQVDEEGDLRFGRVVQSPGHRVFLETAHDPRSVVCVGRRARDRSNPLGLLLSGASGQPAADLAALAEATIDNHVVALRAAPNCPLPALPLGVLHTDPSGQQKCTWQTQIESRLGKDLYGFDEQQQTVIRKPDGLPEIELCAVSPEGLPNLYLVDLGTKFRSIEVSRQIASGIRHDDLASRGGELEPHGKSAVLKTSASIGPSLCRALREIKGQRRIVLLAVCSESSTAADRCAGFAAGRVMDVITQPGEPPRIMFQPAVLTTRGLVLASERNPGRPIPENAYLYKVQLTR